MVLTAVDSSDSAGLVDLRIPHCRRGGLLIGCRRMSRRHRCYYRRTQLCSVWQMIRVRSVRARVESSSGINLGEPLRQLIHSFGQCYWLLLYSQICDRIRVFWWKSVSFDSIFTLISRRRDLSVCFFSHLLRRLPWLRSYCVPRTALVPTAVPFLSAYEARCENAREFQRGGRTVGKNCSLVRADAGQTLAGRQRRRAIRSLFPMCRRRSAI